MREILRKIIESLAKIRLARFKPVIIGVTGNVGKSSTKQAIIAALKDNKRVRGSDGNLNNEFGVPLSILGGNWSQEYYEKGPSLSFWLRVILIESLKCLLLIKEKSEVLVLEYGADAPGDIKKLANKYTPDIAIVTAVGDIPVQEALPLIRQLRDEGVTVFIIEHIMAALISVSDRVLVMDQGVVIATGSPAELTANPKVIEAYLGEETTGA